MCPNLSFSDHATVLPRAPVHSTISDGDFNATHFEFPERIVFFTNAPAAAFVPTTLMTGNTRQAVLAAVDLARGAPALHSKRHGPA